jgi:hypothetical protein
LLSVGKSQIWVANNLGVTKQRISYWTNHPISPKKRKTKFEKLIKLLKLLEISQQVKLVPEP